MKATITAAGMLVVVPENELEAYALQRWCSANLTDWYSGNAKGMPVIVDFSHFPDATHPGLCPGSISR